MKLLRISTIVIFAIAGIFSLQSCKKDKVGGNDVLNPNLPVFDMDLFEQNIIDAVTDGTMDPTGWAYAIGKDGQLSRTDDFGSARLIGDGIMPFSNTKQMHAASVGKFYTGIAALQLIYRKGLTINSKIAPWLPQTWSKGPGVDQLSFADLLRHESGLSSYNTSFSSTLSYEGLKKCIDTGVVNSKSRTYLNANFAMFRILIPSLWKGLNDAPNIDINSDQSTQAAYLAYMKSHVFEPAGTPNVDCTPEGRMNCTLYYNAADQGTSNKGAYYGEELNIAGGGGFYLTIIEMAAINSYYENSEALLDKELRDIMKENRIGMDTEWESKEIHGSYYGKNGSISNSANQGVLTQIAFFPINHVDVAIGLNCQGATIDGTSLRSLLYDAYNAAWVLP